MPPDPSTRTPPHRSPPSRNGPLPSAPNPHLTAAYVLACIARLSPDEKARLDGAYLAPAMADVAVRQFEWWLDALLDMDEPEGGFPDAEAEASFRGLKAAMQTVRGLLNRKRRPRMNRRRDQAIVSLYRTGKSLYTIHRNSEAWLGEEMSYSAVKKAYGRAVRELADLEAAADDGPAE
jgi:hypothetical protein